MALNLDALGKKIGPVTKDYTWKDAVLYALGVGAGFSELEYCYEKNLKVIPSFSIAAIFEFLSHIGITSNIKSGRDSSRRTGTYFSQSDSPRRQSDHRRKNYSLL